MSFSRKKKLGPGTLSLILESVPNCAQNGSSIINGETLATDNTANFNSHWVVHVHKNEFNLLLSNFWLTFYRETTKVDIIFEMVYLNTLYG